jgi:diguanylate cyclase (GGDEF)-like protein/PAS domain S-box-containing protein
MDILRAVKKEIESLKLLHEKADDDTKLISIGLIENLLSSLLQENKIEKPCNSILDSFENKKLLLQQKNEIIDEFVFMTVSDLNGRILDISKAYLDFTGFSKEDVVGKNHRIFRNEDIDSDIIKNLWDTILKNKIWEGELKNNKSTGEEYWIRAVIKPLYDTNGTKIGYTSIKQDITTQKRLEEISTKDQLTLLHNRRQFEYFIKKELTRSSSKHEKIALMIIEIDYYHPYKDQHGEAKSFAILLEIANALKKNVRLHINIQEIFKISESEFAIVIFNQEDSYIEKVATELIDMTKELKIHNDQNIFSEYFTISIGAANLDTTKYNITSNDLYNIADTNLAQAKK